MFDTKKDIRRVFKYFENVLFFFKWHIFFFFFFAKNLNIIAVNEGLVTIVIEPEFAYKAILFLRAAKK